MADQKGRVFIPRKDGDRMKAKTLKFGVISLMALFSTNKFAIHHSCAEIIPQDRRIDWSQAGIPGGIPNRTTICATINAASTAMAQRMLRRLFRMVSTTVQPTKSSICLPEHTKYPAPPTSRPSLT